MVSGGQELSYQEYNFDISFCTFGVRLHSSCQPWLKFKARKKGRTLLRFCEFVLEPVLKSQCPNPAPAEIHVYSLRAQTDFQLLYFSVTKKSKNKTGNLLAFAA